MKYSWTQPYFPEGKYTRLYQAQLILTNHKELMTLDKLEPIEDLTLANKYLNKFRLEK